MTRRLQVPDIHAVRSSLEAKGVVFRADPHVVHRTPTAGLWAAVLSDPDGNQLALMGETPAGGFKPLLP